MTPIEIIALIVAILIAIKIVIILVKPKAWVDSVVKKVWVNPLVIGITCLILAAIVLYYLIQGGMTIIQIFAVMGFVALLGGLGVAVYASEVIGFAEKLLKQGIVKKSWLQLIIWIALTIWALKELLL